MTVNPAIVHRQQECERGRHLANRGKTARQAKAADKRVELFVRDAVKRKRARGMRFR